MKNKLDSVIWVYYAQSLIVNVARFGDDFSKANADRDDVMTRVSTDEIISSAYRWHWLQNHIQRDNFKFNENTLSMMHRKFTPKVECKECE